MKYVILANMEDAQAVQSQDDKLAGLPLPGIYANGQPANSVITQHVYDIITKPDGTAWAYPIQDDSLLILPNEAITVDKLDDSWAITLRLLP